MDAQCEGTRLAGDGTQIKPTTTLPDTLESSGPTENAPALSATQDTTEPPSSTSPKSDLKEPGRTVSLSPILVDSKGHVRTSPVPSVLLETRLSWGDRRTCSYLIPLKELLSWRALKDVLADIRDVDDKTLSPIIYYKDTVVIGKYWLDIVHAGARFVVLYSVGYDFHNKAGVSPSKYWSTE